MRTKQHLFFNDTISFCMLDIRERSGEEDNDEPFVNLHEENIFFTEEDEQAVEQAIKLEQLKQMVIDTDIDF